MGYAVLTTLKVLLYSPIYLSILRIMRISRVNEMIRFLERQKEYKIFKKISSSENGRRKHYFILKWTSTSDQSTLFLDIVKKIDDSTSKLNWTLKFPQTFIICKIALKFSRKWNLQQTIQTGNAGSSDDQNDRPLERSGRRLRNIPPNLRYPFLFGQLH